MGFDDSKFEFQDVEVNFIWSSKLSPNLRFNSFDFTIKLRQSFIKPSDNIDLYYFLFAFITGKFGVSPDYT